MIGSITERLRNPAYEQMLGVARLAEQQTRQDMDEAANEIDRLRKAIDVSKSDCAEAFAENDRLRSELAALAATNIRHHQEIGHLRALVAEMRSKVETIARLAAPAARNLDQIVRDLDYILDSARAILAKTEDAE